MIIRFAIFGNIVTSYSGFAWVYRFVQGSTAIFGLLAFLVESPFLQLHRNPAGILIGCATALLGLGIFRSAKTTLGRHYSPCFDSFLPRDVQLDGIYRRVRHPIYTGNIVILLGLTLATGSPALAINLFLVTVYYSLSARREEAALAERFPEYREYVGRSGRFVPFALPDD